jgi:hypothetical protein
MIYVSRIHVSRNRLLPWAASCAALIFSGCSHAPTYDIMGSLFPAWLVCILLGIILMGLTRWLLLRYGVALLYPVLVYSCLAAAFIFAIWLFFF